jgi:hypothetical protein
MEAAHPAPSQSLPNSPTSPNAFRPVFTDSVRFWEPRRLFYNFVLLAAALSWLAATWPHFRPALALTPILMLSVLALLANVCYSAAYLIDIPLQLSALSFTWKRYRWILWLLGTLFALLLANYWIADEIYPDFR